MKNILLMFIVSIILLVGCTPTEEAGNQNEMKENNQEKKIDEELILNDRQKEILAYMGLSTEPDELEPHQRVSIQRIEELLVSLEKKYNKEFAYAGYILPGLLEREQLFAYPMDQHRRVHEFTLTVDGNGNLSDDYFEVSLMYPYEEFVTERLTSVIPDANFKLFARVNSTDLTETPDNPEEFIGTVSSSIKIIFQADGKDEHFIKQMGDTIQSFADENKLYGTYDLVFLKDIDMKDVNRFNSGDLDQKYIIDSFYVHCKKK